MAAKKPRTAATGRTQSTTKPRSKAATGARSAKAAATAQPRRPRPRFPVPGRPSKLVLGVVGFVAFLLVGFIAISVLSAEETSGSEELPPPDPFEARDSSRQQLTTLRLEALCEHYGDLADAHGETLDLPPEDSIRALARLEAAVPDEGSPLDLAFAHLRAGIERDIEAAAWTAAGAHERAIEAYRDAEVEALQSEAYALAACES